MYARKACIIYIVYSIYFIIDIINLWIIHYQKHARNCQICRRKDWKEVFALKLVLESWFDFHNILFISIFFGKGFFPLTITYNLFLLMKLFFKTEGGWRILQHWQLRIFRIQLCVTPTSTFESFIFNLKTIFRDFSLTVLMVITYYQTGTNSFRPDYSESEQMTELFLWNVFSL